MTAIAGFLSQEIVQRIGWALIHFIWQGAAVALGLALCTLLLRRRSANARYLAACAAMILMALLPAATFWVQGIPAAKETPAPASSQAIGISASSPPAEFARSEVQGGGEAMDAGVSAELPAERVPEPGQRVPLPRRVGNALEANVGWIAAGWAAGVLLLSVRLLISLAKAQRMRRSGSGEGCGCWQEMVERIAARLTVGRPVRVLRSCLARAPVAIGWLRPAILLPASALTGLTPEQLEAILAHELAHIRRHDYIVNLFQAAAETLLFYHPAVHWVSHRMRVEREHCCDDVAVSVCGDSSTYARALAKMAELEQAPSAAMAATGGMLLGRISRLLGMRAPKERAASLWLVGLAGLGVLLAVTITIVAASAAATAAPEQSAPSPDAIEIQVDDILAKADQLEAEHKQRYQEYIASLSDEELARRARSLTPQEVIITLESTLEWVKKDRPKIVQALQKLNGPMSAAEEPPFTQRRSELVKDLAALGHQALPVLLREGQQWPLIQDAILAMWPDAIPPLLEFADSPDGRVRGNAIQILSRARDPRAKDVLIRAVYNRDAQPYPLEGLISLGPEVVGKERLAEALVYDLRYGSCTSSIFGLEAYGDERAIDPLKVVEQFWPNHGAKGNMRYHARVAINAIEQRAGKEVKEASREDYPETPPSREELLKAAECPNAEIRRIAAMRLAEMSRDEDTALFLIDRLAKEEDPAVIGQIGNSLWSMTRPQEGLQAPGSSPLPASVVQKAFDAFLSIAERGASADLREKEMSGAESMVHVARQRKQRLDGFPRFKAIVRQGLSSEDPDVRRDSFSAVTAIARFGDETGDGWEAAEKKALQAQLSPLLNVPKPEIRLIECLGYVGDRELTPRMLELLKHKDSTIRRFAAWALGRIGDPAALPELRRVAETDPAQWADGTYPVREEAKRAIWRMSPKPQPNFKPQARDSTASPQPQAETSQEGPQSESVEIQVDDILAKVEQLEREHERLLREKWERLDEKERELYALRNPYMASGLEKQLEDVVKETQAKIVAVGEPAIPALIELLADTRTRTYYRNCVIGSLVKMGAASVPALIEALHDGTPRQRSEAAFVFGNIRDRRAVDPLVLALKDDDPDVRADAADALGHFRDPDTVNPIAMALQDKDMRVQQEAAESLGEIGDPSAVPALIDAIRARSAEMDKSYGVFRSLAYTALGRIGDTRAVPILVEGLSDEGVSPHKAQVAGIDAAEALGNLGGPEAARALETAANEHRREDVRKAAREALEKIRKEELQAAGESFHVIAKWIHIGPPSERYLFEGSPFGSGFRPLDWSAVQLDADDQTVADDIKSLVAELCDGTLPRVDIFHTLEGTACIGEKIVSHAPGREAEVTLEAPPAKAGLLGLRYELRVPTGGAAPPPFNVRDMRAIVPLGRNSLLTFSGGYLAKSAPPGEGDMMLCLVRIDPAEPAAVEKEENEVRKAASEAVEKIEQKAGKVAGGWSEGVKGVKGRLVVENPVIRMSEQFDVFAELKNVGEKPVVLEVERTSVGEGGVLSAAPSGEKFGLSVTDASGAGVEGSVASDYSCRFASRIFKAGETIRFRVSRSDTGKGQLAARDTVWTLGPGKYKLECKLGATYDSKTWPPDLGGGFVEDGAIEPNLLADEIGAKLWRGELVLPAVEVEVMGEEGAGGAPEQEYPETTPAAPIERIGTPKQQPSPKSQADG